MKENVGKTFLRILQGSLIGLGAVLPGISGGVLCVIFGIYQPIMEFLADPFGKWKTRLPQLIPVFLGAGIGFLGVSNILSVLLERYPGPSVCLFIGLIVGMLPSLFSEAGKEGRNQASYLSMIIAMIIIFALLLGLKMLSIEITPNVGWYVFCGVCLAISVIAPGMSFSTLLMPLGLYEPFVSGIGHLNMSICIPAGIGALATIILLSKAVNSLFEHHYSIAFHAIIGIVAAATVMIIPFETFTGSFSACIMNLVCLAVGGLIAFGLDFMTQKI